MGGPTFVTDPTRGRALDLSGSSEYVSLPPGASSAQTIAGWVKWYGGSQWERIFDFGQNDQDYFFLTPSDSSNLVQCSITTDIGIYNQEIESPSAFPINRWTYVAVVMDGREGILYINGSAVAVNYSVNLLPSDIGATNVNLGKSSYPTDPYYYGLMSSISLNSAPLLPNQLIEPIVTMTLPAGGTRFAGGAALAYSGTATDFAGNPLPASSYSWSGELYSNGTMVPVFGPATGVTNGAYQVPTNGPYATNSFYTIGLTVTDTNGNTQAVSTIIPPQTASLTLATVPNGLQITLDGQPLASGTTLTEIVGMNHVVSATSPQPLESTNYGFVLWSDGGAETHDVLMPASATTLTASFEQPVITATVAGSELNLAWPQWAGAMQLYSATNLSSPVAWTLVTNTAVTSNNELNVTVPMTNTVQFFQPPDPMSVIRNIVFAIAPIVCSAGLLTAGPEQHFFANPICEQADPWIVQDHGHYLACFSEGNRGISVQISDRLTVLGPKHVVWAAPDSGPASGEVWAPELHSINGRWYICFAASDGENKNHRAWVLQSAGPDALGPYTLHGPLYTGDDPNLSSGNRWAIDLTVFESNKQLYAVWSGWKDDQDVQYLYIAPMKDPMTIAGRRVQLCANDDYLWERVDESPNGRGLNEAPEVLEHNGRTFVTYSCSGSWQPSYKVGLLELKPGTDPLQTRNWTKHPLPAFASTAATYGVGHNSFVKSPDGTEDWLVYHVKLDRQNGWRRAVFTQRFNWTADGLPQFGAPVGSGQLLPLPSGERVPRVSGTRHFQFRDASDLENWPYYGHHQFVRVEDGRLYLGELRGQPVNEFRSGEKVVFDGGLWTNFTMTAKFSLLDGQGQAGLLFRASTPFLGYSGQRGYFAGINSKKRIVLGSFDGKRWHQMVSAPLDPPLGENCEMKITAHGDELQVDCNGHRVLEARDGAYDSGTIGLRVVDMHAAFSDVQITPVTAEETTAASLAGRQ